MFYHHFHISQMISSSVFNLFGRCSRHFHHFHSKVIFYFQKKKRKIYKRKALKVMCQFFYQNERKRISLNHQPQLRRSKLMANRFNLFLIFVYSSVIHVTAAPAFVILWCVDTHTWILLHSLFILFWKLKSK